MKQIQQTQAAPAATSTILRHPIALLGTHKAIAGKEGAFENRAVYAVASGRTLLSFSEAMMAAGAATGFSLGEYEQLKLRMGFSMDEMREKKRIILPVGKISTIISLLRSWAVNVRTFNHQQEAFFAKNDAVSLGAGGIAILRDVKPQPTGPEAVGMGDLDFIQAGTLLIHNSSPRLRMPRKLSAVYGGKTYSIDTPANHAGAKSEILLVSFLGSDGRQAYQLAKTGDATFHVEFSGKEQIEVAIWPVPAALEKAQARQSVHSLDLQVSINPTQSEISPVAIRVDLHPIYPHLFAANPEWRSSLLMMEEIPLH
jgi:hypothetical protein